MRALKNICTQAAEIALAWAWLVEDYAGAGNILMACIWLTALISVFTLSDTVRADWKKSGARPTPAWVTTPLMLALVCLLLWFGAFGTAVARLARSAFTAAAWASVNKAEVAKT